MSIISKIKRKAYQLTVFGGIQFLLLTLLAMIFFPGGTAADPNATHYLFFENFFSDLGRSIDFEGEPNLISRILFTLSLTLQGIIVIIFFFTLPSIFSDSKKSKKWTVLMTILGVVSGIGFIGVAHTPWDLCFPEHVFFVNLAFRSLLLASIFMLIKVYKTDYFQNVYGHILLIVCFLLFGYVLLLIFGPDPQLSRYGLLLQATCQKIVVYSLVFGITIFAYGATKIQKGVLANLSDNK